MNIVETIIVKNFGPITDVAIDFKRITLLIGPSGSGKSTLLKAVAMMRHITKMELVRSVLRDFNIKGKKLPRLRSETYIHNAGFDGFFTPSTLLEYVIRVDNSELRIEIDGSKRIRVNGALPDGLLYKIAFITDMRSALAMWTDGGARSVARGIKSLDYYFNETFDIWTTALEHLPSDGLSLRHFPGMRVVSKRNAFHQRAVSIKVDDANQQDFRLARAASGIKTSIPLVVMLEYLCKGNSVATDGFRRSILDQAFESGFDGKQVEKAINRLSNYWRAKTLVSIQIEEPEISLDPTTQVDLLRTMVSSAIDCEEDRIVTLAFATHSPYVLTSLNDLLMAERFARLKDGIISPTKSIAGCISAWQIKAGYAKDLVDTESGFVVAEEMDEVSELLGNRMCSALSEGREE